MSFFNCAVIIPVYKSDLNPDEIKSFTSCLSNLSDKYIVIVTHRNVILNEFFNIADEYSVPLHVEYFNENYFRSISGYSLLCMSKLFYKRFSKFQYMLILQLDVFIFSNKLDYWCNKSYDYIGAPLVKKVNNIYEISGNYYNGGLSLRNTDFFIKSYNNKWYKHCVNVSVSRPNGNKILKVVHGLILAFISKYNIPFVSFNVGMEDMYMGSVSGLKKPIVEEAMLFSYEDYPEYLFSLTNKLPFGVHKWERYKAGFYSDLIK